jgi:hypothetical protein
MSCPFFKESHNIGFCNTSEFSYIPTLCEMEQQCFTDSFGTCSNYFDNFSAKEHNLISHSQVRKSQLPTGVTTAHALAS